MNKILAFDTTNATLSVAILFNQKLVAQKNILENNKHSEMLIPAIEECLRQVKIWYQDLSAIAFTNGPGSFTGIRVGYSCAKALKIATNLPIIAVNSLEAIAYSYLNCNATSSSLERAGEEKSNNPERPERILVVNDARLGEFFIQEFIIKNNQLNNIGLQGNSPLGSANAITHPLNRGLRGLQSIFEPMMIKVDELSNFLPKERFLLAGSAKHMIKDDLKNALILDKDDFIDAKNIALLAETKYFHSHNHNTESSALYIRSPKISERKKGPCAVKGE